MQNELIIPNAPQVVLPGGVSIGMTTSERFMASGLNPMALRTTTVLQKEEWIELDTVVIEEARQRLRAVQDLIDNNLVIRLQNGLGTTVFQWEDMSDMTAANVSMDAVTSGQRDRLTFDLNSIPLPIVHKDFSISLRVLEASRRTGAPLDTTQAGIAGKLVSEQIETMLITGQSGLTFGGGTLRGYTDHGDRNTVTLAENWDAAGKTGEEMIADVLAMVTAAQADRFYGPYMLYVPTAYWVEIQDDYKANSDRTIIERIRAIDGIQNVRVLDLLTANNVLLVSMTGDTVKEIVGLEPTVVQWETQGGMVQHFKVMAIMVPRIASDHSSRSGIVHLAA